MKNGKATARDFVQWSLVHLWRAKEKRVIGRHVSCDVGVMWCGRHFTPFICHFRGILTLAVNDAACLAEEEEEEEEEVATDNQHMSCILEAMYAAPSPLSHSPPPLTRRQLTKETWERSLIIFMGGGGDDNADCGCALSLANVSWHNNFYFMSIIHVSNHKNLPLYIFLSKSYQQILHSREMNDVYIFIIRA